MALDKLFQSIQERWRPEDVAAEIVTVGHLTDQESKLMEPLLHIPLYSSMSNRFAKADDLSRQIRVATELFPQISVSANTASADETNEYIERLRTVIGASGNLDFKLGRLTHKERKEADVSHKGHRAYNKRFRLLSRMAEKLEKYRHNLLMRNLAQVAKSRLTFRITREDFFADPDTAMYIAYIVSRLNLRSQFTWGQQDRAFDRVGKMLLDRLYPERAQWFAIALVDPDPAIIGRLDSNQKGRLINEWYEVMKTAARILRDLAERYNFNLDTMIVKKGDDSSSWNEAAGAFNKCRQGWVNTMIASGMDSIFDAYLPGKALRLMAADVAYMHRHYGSGDLHPDTKVWNDLPKPWEVLFGETTCNKNQIIETCAKYELDPKGWIASL